MAILRREWSFSAPRALPQLCNSIHQFIYHHPRSAVCCAESLVLCIVLSRFVLHCSMLHCIVLYCIVLCCSVFSCIALYCIVLCCIVLCCILVHHVVLNHIVLYSIILDWIVSDWIVSCCIVLFLILDLRFFLFLLLLIFHNIYRIHSPIRLHFTFL